MNNRRFLKQVLGFSLVTLILVGCGGATVEPTATPTILPSPTPLSAKAILEMAVATMEELESYHFEMILQMTISSEGTTAEVPLTFIGDFKAPESLRGELTMEMLGLTIETEFISIGGIFYIKDPTSGEWQISTESATPFSPEDFVGLEPDDIANMEDLVRLGEEDLDGVPVYHIQGKVSAETLEAAIGKAKGDVKVDYWIGIEDGRVRQVDVEMELFVEGGDQEELNATASFKISEFDKEVIIEAP